MTAISAIKLRTKNHLASFFIFFPVLAVIMLALCTGRLFPASANVYTITATSFSVIVFAFVIGICSVREDLRLLIQFGVSRRTGFMTRLVSALLLSVVGAVAGELLLALSQAVSAAGVQVLDIYQAIYLPEGATFTLGGHLRAVAMNAALTLAMFQLGEFFSLIFMRTRKAGTVALGIFVGVFPGVILPALLSIRPIYDAVVPAAARFIAWLGLSVWNLVLAALLGALVCLALNGLLQRRAPIRAAKS